MKLYEFERGVKMESFADYIMKEQELAAKMEITYYLAKKTKIFFDKSVIFKTELARLFLNYATDIDVDRNIVLTACLLCNCKKVEGAQMLQKLKTYAKEGANYLEEMGFDKRFCKICEEVNRYSQSNPREKESDILELVDHFGGMLLNRPERIGLKPDEALVLLEHRNLKDRYNRYLNTFSSFVMMLENIKIEDIVEIKALRKLAKMCEEDTDIKQFIKDVIYTFEPTVDQLMNQKIQEIHEENRSLFSEETNKKFIGEMENKKINV